MLEEIAKLWKSEGGGVIVEDGPRLRSILKVIEGGASAGREGSAAKPKLTSADSFIFGNDSAIDLSIEPSQVVSTTATNANDEEVHDEAHDDPRVWLKVHSAFDLPRFNYDMDAKHFIPISQKPSLFPPPFHKTALFRNRYNSIHQRLLRNEAFQAPSFNNAAVNPAASTTTQQFYKLTPIANLLGRGGSSHLLLGMLIIAPTGTLALTDLSGSIFLDLTHASPLASHDRSASSQPYYCPGMIVLIDGIYEETFTGAGSSGLGATGGVGGMIGGRFLGFSIGSPPVEKRDVSLGVNLANGDVGGGLGWTDFLGLGSERAIGPRMRKLEQKLLNPTSSISEERRKMIILSHLPLDTPSTLPALRHVLSTCAAASAAPLCFLLIGPFCSTPSLAGTKTGSIEYKLLFDALALLLCEFPSLLKESTFIFAPGDNDAWPSSFAAGASTMLPREGIPDVFSSRVSRVFAAEGGTAVWTTNPSRISLFGGQQEIAICRDDIAARFRRSAVKVGGAQTQAQTVEGSATPVPQVDESTDDYSTIQAKRLIMTLLPQSTLSPFPLSIRPVHWDFASSALSLYPLPTTLVLADASTEAFTLTFEGCHVVNPGRLVVEGGKRRMVGWVEYDLWRKRGEVKSGWIG